jgi:Ran GTPase-activating protein (RanGAP) involved in mRNA processing and transport
MAIGDDDLLLLAKYIQMDPALRSLSLASNSFTDAGLNEIIAALSKNTKLNHMNLLENANLSDWSLKNLQQAVTDINMSLYEIELDLDKYSPEVLE